MKLMLSRKCKYALQSVIYLATRLNTQPALLTEIADGLDIPSPFLSKIMQELVHGGIVTSRKGKGGGFLLKTALSELSLYDVVTVIDGADFLDQCILGFPDCNDEHPCLVHDDWARAKQILLAPFKEKTVAELKERFVARPDTVPGNRQGITS